MKIQACKRLTGLDPGQVPGPQQLSEPHLSGVDELLWVDVEQFLGVLDPDAVRILLQDLGVGGRDRDSLDAAVARPARVGQARVRLEVEGDSFSELLLFWPCILRLQSSMGLRIGKPSFSFFWLSQGRGGTRKRVLLSLAKFWPD